MDSISNINTSLYTDLITTDFPTIPVRQTSMAPVEAVEQNSTDDNSYYDFNNYYNDVQYEDPLLQAGENVIQSAQALDNILVSALENGFSIQDACNIKLAQIAYKANCAVFKSTFELKI